MMMMLMLFDETNTRVLAYYYYSLWVHQKTAAERVCKCRDENTKTPTGWGVI